MAKNKIYFFLLLFIGVFASVRAHEIRPAFLGITEDSAHTLTILWKQPVAGEVGVRLIPHITSGWLEKTPAEVTVTNSFLMKKWIIPKSNVKLEGQKITIEGLDETITDVLLNISLADGKNYSQIIRPADPEYTITGGNKPLQVVSYMFLGIEHILEGVDHLLFVLGFILLVNDRKKLFKAITAFTIAHSITLTAATMKWLALEPPVVETIVALSIVFMAVELVHSMQGKPGLTASYPWIIAFSFGLLHGFGFAGALANVGLPDDAIPLSLFMFNIGVEIGQLIFVFGVLAIIWVLNRLPWKLPKYANWIPPYGIGIFSAVWFIERLWTLVFPQ